MANNNKRNEIFNSIFKSSITVYCVLVALCGVGALAVSLPLGLVLIALALGMLVNTLLERMNRGRVMSEYFERLTRDIDGSGRESLSNIPIPAAVIWLDGRISWYNASFKALFEDEIYDRRITELLSGIEIDKLTAMTSENEMRAEAGGRIFLARGSVLKNEGALGSAIIIYLEEITELELLKNLYAEEKTIAATISVDNYEEAVSDAPDALRPKIIAELDRMINLWIGEAGGIAKKQERDRYVCVFSNRTLSGFINSKFDILDKVRHAGGEAKIPPTLSIGIGIGGDTLGESDAFARAALDIALGRGGDQVVIKDKESLRYFGGKSKEVEKRTKVKARVVAYALRELISQSDRVLIMGHKNVDADALGAALGISCAVASRGKIAHILLGAKDETATALLESMEKNHYHEGLFIGRQQAREMVTDKTLIVVCDTHKAALAEMPELLQDAGARVVIDHHRRGEDFIKDADIVYHEPFASSASEMVTEILQYIDPRLSLSTVDAEALYAGIVVDTKNFTFKTGVRTFEAAAYLKQTGVDTVKIKRLLQSSFENYESRAFIVSNAEFLREGMAISVIEDVFPQTVIAQAADDLLGIRGVGASFVVAAQNDASIAISGRSLGGMNVQMILEKLGGGGHMLAAAAQLEGVKADEARSRLLAAIDEYLSGLSQ